MCTNIRQLEEKLIASEIVFLQWSDRMDLIAVANTKGEVSLHRLTWQRVWLLCPEKDGILVNSLTWRPDGKIIAIAYNNDSSKWLEDLGYLRGLEIVRHSRVVPAERAVKLLEEYVNVLPRC